MPIKASIAPSAAWPTPAGAFVLTAGFTAVCYAAAGASLGVFVGGLVATAIVVPALSAAETRWLRQLLAAGGGLLGAAAVWLFVILQYQGGGESLPFTAGQWLACTTLLAAWCAALLGLTALLLRLKFHPIAAFSSIAILATIWLAFPFWVSSIGGGDSAAPTVQKIIDAYPPFVIDGVLLTSTRFPWREHRILYSQTNLGDETPFSLPASIRVAALLYLLIGAAGLGLAELKKGRPALLIFLFCGVFVGQF